MRLYRHCEETKFTLNRVVRSVIISRNLGNYTSLLLIHRLQPSNILGAKRKQISLHRENALLYEHSMDLHSLKKRGLMLKAVAALGNAKILSLEYILWCQIFNLKHGTSVALFYFVPQLRACAA